MIIFIQKRDRRYRKIIYNKKKILEKIARTQEFKFIGFGVQFNIKIVKLYLVRKRIGNVIECFQGYVYSFSWLK